MKPTKLIPLLFAGALMSASPSKGNAQSIDEFIDPPSFSRDVRIDGYNGNYSIYVGGKKVYSISGVSKLKVSVLNNGIVINDERIFTWKDLEQRVSPSNSNVVKMLPKPPIPSDNNVAYGKAAAKAAAAATASTSAIAAGGEITAYDLEKEIIGLAEDKDKNRRISYEEFYPALMSSKSKEEYLKDLKEVKEITMHLKEGGGTPELNGGVILLNVNGDWLKNEKGDTVYYKTFTDALVKASWISKEYRSKGKTADIRYWGSISNAPHPERSGSSHKPVSSSVTPQQALDEIVGKLGLNFPDKMEDSKTILEAIDRINKAKTKEDYLEILKLPLNKRLASSALNNLGCEYMYEEDYERAIKVYQKALEMDLNNTASKHNLATSRELISKEKLQRRINLNGETDRY